MILCFAGPVRRPVDRAGRLGRAAHGEACRVGLSGAPHRCPRDDARALGPGVGVVRGGGRLSRSVEGDGRARAPSLPLDGGRGLLADAIGGPAVDKSRDGAASAGFRVAASSFVDDPWSEGAWMASTAVMGMLGIATSRSRYDDPSGGAVRASCTNERKSVPVFEGFRGRAVMDEMCESAGFTNPSSGPTF